MNEIPAQDRVNIRPLPNEVSIYFQSRWNIVTPSVYRYEDQCWIDEFFKSGKLRLSTFAKFATYPDENRGDSLEGKSFCYGETTDNKSVVIIQQQGINAVVLCCSHSLNHNLKNNFKRDSAFEITNTVAFCNEIGRQLVGFRQGIEGSCIYRKSRIVKRSIDLNLDDHLNKHRQPDGTLNIQTLPHIAEHLGGAELVLLKKNTYAHQQEYRLLWELDTIVSDHVDVVAPLARQYCRRIELDEWDN